jgi:hypothetical protein
MLGGYLGNMNNFVLAFIITGIMSLLAAGIIATVKVPVKQEAGESAGVQACGAPKAAAAE